MTVLKQVKRISLASARMTRIFSAFRDSEWRRRRLLILCYHGISILDEHRWRPSLFMQPSVFEDRMELLARHEYNALPLNEAIDRLYSGNLPHRSVAITFDDGGHDFHRRAFPVLRKYGFPATVYQTTYYSERGFPIFHLICSYMLWRCRGAKVRIGDLFASDSVVDLTTHAVREETVRTIEAFADRESLSAEARDQLAGRLADRLGIDYPRLCEKRVLQLMNAGEISELASAGVDFQLHTHRHQSPLSEALYKREIRDNRAWLLPLIPDAPRHFCYPSGNFEPSFEDWLTDEGVVSATTCEPGMATRNSKPLRLPRLVDHAGLSSVEFEGWLTGVASLIPQRDYHVPRAA